MSVIRDAPEQIRDIMNIANERYSGQKSGRGKSGPE